MGSAVLLAFQVPARNVAEDVQPDGRVAPNLDLRLGGSKRVEGLIEEIANDACRGLIASGADVVDGQVVIHAQVALDEACNLPVVRGAVEALEDEDVASTGGATVAFAAALMVWVRQCGANRVTEGRGVARLGRTDAVGQTSFFHAASCATA